jgi:HPr kinase/phosphorylase
MTAIQDPTPPLLTVAGLLERGSGAADLPLEVLSGTGGLQKPIANPYIQKTGLALAGYDEYLRPGRIFVLGESEVRYLERLSHEARRRALDTLLTHDIPCVLITGGWDAPDELLAAAERHAVPVLRTSISTPIAIARMGALLDDALAARQIIHGVLVDVLGLGVLIIGDSGLGKSECALDLIVQGHRLVADDAVQIWARGDSALGTCPDATKHHMELRGLGIVNVRDLFGVASTRDSMRVGLVVRFERWEPDREYDRLGLEERTHDLVGVRLPLICMPVAPGRNLATLVEVAARNQILRAQGVDGARDFVARLDRSLRDDHARVDPVPPTTSGGQE